MEVISRKNKIKYFVSLHLLLFVFSICGILSKLAAQETSINFRFIAFYGGVILILGVYAIFWQQIIKRLPLTTAYANKAVTIVWGIIWGFLLFGEEIKWNKIVGALVVICGVIVVVKSDE